MKRILVIFPNGDIFSIPAEVVAKNRTDYYESTNKSEFFDYIEEYGFVLNNNDQLYDWITNNMDWKDVKDHAVLVEQNLPKNYAEAWNDAQFEVVNHTEE